MNNTNVDMDRDLVSQWNKTASMLADSRDVHLLAISLVNAEIKKDDLILDVGCGKGGLFELLESMNFKNLIAAEFSPVLCQILRKRLKRTEIVNADGCFLPFSSEIFDVIFCTEVIEHLIAPDQSLQELVRVLKPEGIIVLTTDTLLTKTFKLLGLETKQPINRTFSCNEMKRLLNDVGLRVDAFIFYGPNALMYLPDRFIGLIIRFIKRFYPSLFGRLKSIYRNSLSKNEVVNDLMQIKSKIKKGDPFSSPSRFLWRTSVGFKLKKIRKFK